MLKVPTFYSRDTWVNDLNDKSASRLMPTVGYDGDDDKGMYIRLRYDYNIDQNTTLKADLPYYSQGHFKPVAEVKHDQRNYYLTYQSGWFEEDE